MRIILSFDSQKLISCIDGRRWKVRRSLGCSSFAVTHRLVNNLAIEPAGSCVPERQNDFHLHNTGQLFRLHSAAITHSNVAFQRDFSEGSKRILMFGEHMLFPRVFYVCFNGTR